MAAGATKAKGTLTESQAYTKIFILIGLTVSIAFPSKHCSQLIIPWNIHHKHWLILGNVHAAIVH